MAESCANTEGQGSSLCGLQMTCSSDITSNLKKQLHHGSQDTMLDDGILHLDSTELKCGGASYKHTSDNGYGEKSVPIDMSVSGKCIDSYQAPDSNRTDKEMISSKESSSLFSSPPSTGSSLAKSNLSSAFMISSLLSTKTVSSFTTILTQACSGNQSQQLKVTNSTSNCDSLPRTSTESSSRLCETKQNTLPLETDCQNVSGNVVHNNLNHSEDVSRDSNTGQLSDEHLDKEQLSSVEQQNNENSIGVVSALRGEDVEDMQVEETSSLTMADPALDVDMISPGAISEPGNSITELNTEKTIDGQSISALKSDFLSKTDVCNENNVPDEPEEMQAQNSADDDVLLIDENTDADNSDSVLESDQVDTSLATVGATVNVAMLEHTSADLINSVASSSLVKNQNMSRRENSGSIDVCSSKTTVTDHQTVLDFSVKSQQSNISDSSVLDISDLENTQIQTQVRLDVTNDIKEEEGKDGAEQPDQSLMKRDLQPSTVAEPEVLQKEVHKQYSVDDTLKLVGDNGQMVANSELPEVNTLNTPLDCEETSENTSKLKVSTHSTNTNDNLVNRSETNNLNEKTKEHHEVSLDKNVDAGRIQDTHADLPVQETNSVIVGNPLVVRKESFNNQDCITRMDKVGDNVAANCSVEKYTFKTILFKPKDSTASKKSPAIVEGTDFLTSTDMVVQVKSEAIVNYVGEKSVTQSAVSDTTSSQSYQNESDMDTVSAESVVVNDTANERKRFQTENFFSASKRSRLDSLGGGDEKVVKDDTPKLDKVILSEKCFPSTEVKSTVKTKDDKAVLLSNEVLQSLITLRVKAFIKNQKQANIERLNLRTRGMQSASNLWKETAKHLERSVLELTALNQKLESRKAHLIAVKRLASRTMSTQTSEDNTSSASSAAPSPSSTPIQRNPSVSTLPTVQRTGRPGRPPLYQRPIPNIPPPVPPPPVPPPPVAAQEKTAPSNKTMDTAVHTNNVNLIDLTDDEETSRNVIAKTSKVVAPQTPNHAANKLYTAGIKTAAAPPANGYLRQSPQMQGTSSSLFGSGSQITQHPVSGSQHLTTSNTADTQLHLVTPTNSAAHHSGTANPLGPRSGGGPSSYGLTGQSNMTNSRNLAQNPAPPAVVSPSAIGASKTPGLSLPPSFLISHKHPAPLPSNMDTGNAPFTAKKRPPKPSLKISRVSQGIVLSWNMPSLFDVEKIASYQLYAYQESDSTTPRSSLWKKVGEVTALPLPMACTLTQFQEGNKYHFAVRAVDQYGRCGSYSDPSSIYLGPKS